MKIAILTNEYPPHIYGGAGVHVENLSRELAGLAASGSHHIEVLCFGEQAARTGALSVQGVQPSYHFDTGDAGRQKLLDTLLRDLVMTGNLQHADIIHCHTWYTHLAGCLLKQLLQVPLVLTTHSLEPHRPWKAEQLGAAYHVSTWMEKTAYENADGVIAVSGSMRQDVQRLYRVAPEKIRVIYNGIDVEQYRPTPDPAVPAGYGIDPQRPFILFVGRITRQKGIIHLVNAIKYLVPGLQVVLCAGAPDTEAIGREMANAVEQARRQTQNDVIWIAEMVPLHNVISLYSMATLFVCPSIYEPFGIINLEAMACGTPVVAAAVGGIPEVVIPEETGLLVPVAAHSATDPEPREPERFSRDLAEAINLLLQSPDRLRTMSVNARHRVEAKFSWKSIAVQTLEYYEQLVRAAKWGERG